MKRVILIGFLAAVLIASVALLAGCGSGSSGTDPEKTVDNAMREAVKGNFQLFADMIPEEYKDYRQSIEESFPYANSTLGEIHYKTETVDADHVTVSFWGTFTLASGETETVPEDQAIPLPLIKQGDQWYFDFTGMAAQAPSE
ncbi:MAG: hypothetical protein A2V52_06460 [Actinobacteria bacterium RBG_19FT_COMBO_54_7]|uniref:DUF4878 domain-containing protein n=1 Tax=Candidatus Solincola sediminis TaxID=1797199 RepID=A0A1F2WJA6_9ACTN|nr:MAG: hypothetical protein A2Y75_07265 [Candidatus Solincola sediminis]OFW59652.1 MAG: hypothetical protein A2W01_01110 [Candidatus Solincola sediminis]OFW68474.1 MAG: hypothetical protein A2V52_06460 [Actinobacteria bacterium RBG_19FT_COMBO_54_7]